MSFIINGQKQNWPSFHLPMVSKLTRFSRRRVQPRCHDTSHYLSQLIHTCKDYNTEFIQGAHSHSLDPNQIYHVNNHNLCRYTTSILVCPHRNLPTWQCVHFQNAVKTNQCTDHIMYSGDVAGKHRRHINYTTLGQRHTGSTIADGFSDLYLYFSECD